MTRRSIDLGPTETHREIGGRERFAAVSERKITEEIGDPRVGHVMAQVAARRLERVAGERLNMNDKRAAADFWESLPGQEFLRIEPRVSNDAGLSFNLPVILPGLQIKDENLRQKIVREYVRLRWLRHVAQGTGPSKRRLLRPFFDQNDFFAILGSLDPAVAINTGLFCKKTDSGYVISGLSFGETNESIRQRVFKNDESLFIDYLVARAARKDSPLTLRERWARDLKPPAGGSFVTVGDFKVFLDSNNLPYRFNNKDHNIEAATIRTTIDESEMNLPVISSGKPLEEERPVEAEPVIELMRPQKPQLIKLTQTPHLQERPLAEKITQGIDSRGKLKPSADKK